jgi:hypothetical protein
MLLYRHKSTGFVVAAEQLNAPKSAQDSWGARFGKPGRNPRVGDYALWWGGRHVKYLEEETFESEYERL